MPTLTLHAGTVSHWSTAGSIAGSGAIWDDGSDATYLESDTTYAGSSGWVGSAPLDLLSLPAGATVNSVTVNLRAASVVGTDTPARVDVGVYQGPGTFPPFDATYQLAVNSYAPTGGWQVETAGVPTDVAHTFDATDFTTYSTNLAALVAALQAGADVYARALSNSGHTGVTVSHRFYELSIVVDYTGTTPAVTHAPPLRKHPRSDGLGTSSARRHWPPPKSVQFSNRRVGGYL